MPLLPLDPYILGASDADIYSPDEHRRGGLLSLSIVVAALQSAELRVTIASVREYLAGFSDRAGFLCAAARVGIVDAVSGEVCS